MTSTGFWKRKLAAWLHDPAEKALVLMRDSEGGQRIGHEHGSVARLRAALGIDARDFDKRADHFAAAADRPQWPAGPDRPAWANVRWAEAPVLVHPLAGHELDLKTLADVAPQAARWISLDHFKELVERDASGQVDERLTFLAFWRFGYTPPTPDIGALWQMLPADTRVPDHSIWQHLDAVSALAGALAGDEPALLTLAIGPVQGFIAQARSTADLWAGSHLLASLAWEAMRPIVEALGPDAVLFPALRGVPQVDLWLLEQVRQQADAARHDAWLARFEHAGAPWVKRDSDENALFSAALPNKFTAIVPRSRARELAEAATRSARAAALQWALEAADRLFGEVGRDASHAHAQVRAQLEGFPEVAWAAVDWPTAQGDDGLPESTGLAEALAAFASEGAAKEAPQGFFDGAVWQLLAGAQLEEQEFEGGRRKRRTLQVEGHDFFTANAGLLYPAVHQASELALAAAKACRTFNALRQDGYRCTVTGEAEWLTDDRNPEALFVPRGQRAASVWSDVARKRPAWAKPGERLGALATLKRLWPTIYAKRLEAALGREFPRRPVSTHALALAPSFARLIDDADTLSQAQREALDELAGAVRDSETTLLPRSLAVDLQHHGNEQLMTVARHLPAALEQDEDAASEAQRERLARLKSALAKLLGHRHETYYAAIKLDGDRMGAWLAGDDEQTQLRFIDTWHPQVRAKVRDLAAPGSALARYVHAPRPASPARHMFVSTALNHFSQEVARHVVEEVCKGRLVYSGGDDVLALVALDDLLPALLLLRAAYSGDGDVTGLVDDARLRGLRIGRGFVMCHQRVLPTMGARATLSAGAVIAHHTAPLAHVLRCLDEAERQAKADGRNRWHLRVMKRAGGELALGATFWPPTPRDAEPAPAMNTPAGFLLRLAQQLDATEFSRRAIYAASDWLARLTPRGDAKVKLADGDWRAMVQAALVHQFERQKGLAALAREAVDIACAETAGSRRDTREYLSHLLLAAEFLGRQRRSGGSVT
jgi:CRISPR-associated protein Cmr2